MSRLIKFRGRSINTGEFVYGDFVHEVPMSSFPGIVDENGMVHEVYSDSIAQFVGYDMDGNEVYEGDKVQLVVEHGIATVYTAELHAAGRDSAALCHYNFKDTRLLTEATK